jgi:hypothetical protein
MMVLEDRPDYPMVAGVELKFSGTVRRVAMETAFQRALDRNPLLCARVETSLWRGPQWVPADRPSIRWRAADSPETSFEAAGIDVGSGPGLRVSVQPDAPHPTLHARIHHACCDGVGLFQFIEDVLVGYANEVDGSKCPASYRPLETQLLRQRSRFPLNSSSFRQWLYHCYFGINEARKFTMRIPKPLAASQTHAVGQSDSRTPVVSHQGDKQFLKRLRTAAAKRRVTLNDILLRDAMLAIRHWNAEHGSNRPDDLLRILMPCDLRGPEHVSIPAANVMSYSFLTRRMRDCDSPDELLRGVQMETEFIRDRNASLYFIRSLDVARRIPGGIRSVAQSRGCFATLLVSNLGDPTRRFTASFERREGKLTIGDLRLEWISADPPLRPLTRAGIVVCTYPDQLSIGLRYDAHDLSPDDGHGFMNGFVRQLEYSATAD